MWQLHPWVRKAHERPQFKPRLHELFDCFWKCFRHIEVHWIIALWRIEKHIGCLGCIRSHSKPVAIPWKLKWNPHGLKDPSFTLWDAQSTSLWNENSVPAVLQELLGNRRFSLGEPVSVHHVFVWTERQRTQREGNMMDGGEKMTQHQTFGQTDIASKHGKFSKKCKSNQDPCWRGQCCISFVSWDRRLEEKTNFAKATSQAWHSVLHMDLLINWSICSN